MAKRMQEMLAEIRRSGGSRSDYHDKKVLKRLVKAGKVKLGNSGGYGYDSGRTYNMVEAIEPAPVKIESQSDGPYAKRRAACEEAGIAYRGKTWGKIQVDLPREEREKKITEKAAMWKRLKTWQRQ